MSILEGTTEQVDEAFGFDPWDVTWRDGQTVETIDRLVEEHPVHRLPSGQVVLSRYEDLRVALRDESQFSAAPNKSLIGFPPEISPDADPAKIQRLGELIAGLPFKVEDFMAVDVIVALDGQNHRRIRNIVNRGFTPKRIAGLGDRIQEIVDDCVAQVAQADELDLMGTVAVPVPIRTIADLLGVPEHATELKRWSDVLSSCVHGEARGTIDGAIDLVTMLSEFTALFLPLIEQRRGDPGDDVISDIVRATEADTLTVAEAVVFLLVLMAAANETTTSLIGNVVPYLYEHPEQLELLRSDPTLVDNALEETLRLCAPVQFVHRQAVVPMTLHGEEIAAGDVVVCMLAAASRDRREYPDPHAFDLRREGLKKSTLAFGYGGHHCLGANLGRLEGRLALTALLPHLDDFDFDRSDLYLDRSAFTRAYERVPLVRRAR